ncbi:ribonuclease III [Methylogaea oryzae]|uniref:Ribonuclease 3 n=1 Tax=Methylogaea oryzae TaxID=1295382 RepID=A0A8D4VPE7_9GAMM|nr:ribonuclease III [Methylogaea oryzae]BBL70060.1 ribonuclease 3 [Methylogaea oryzae]
MIQSPERLCKQLDLRFHDQRLLQQALTHRSARGANNERLEFLGDSILGFLIAEALYQRFPQADEGVLTRLRAGLVNQSSLAGLARDFDLGDYLVLGAGELKSGGYRLDSVLSDALEAMLGALYLDQGMDACRQWVLRLYADKLAGLSLDSWRKDPKTRLQEWLQARAMALPEYRQLSAEGPPHRRVFTVECRVAACSEPAVASGPSCKNAEQQAAQKILDRLADEAGKPL